MFAIGIPEELVLIVVLLSVRLWQIAESATVPLVLIACAVYAILFATRRG